MVKAHIETEDGTKIDIEGTSEEVNKIISIHRPSNDIKAEHKEYSGKSGDFLKAPQGNWLLKLAKDCKVTETDIVKVVDSEGKGRLINTNIRGKSDAEKQSNAAICIGTILYYSTGSSVVTSKYLHEELEWLGIKSLSNLGPNLKNKKPHIIPEGKPKSRNFSYKISKVGVQSGLELIKEMCA